MLIFMLKSLLKISIFLLFVPNIAAKQYCKIDIQTSEHALKASPDLFGIFVEDWSHQVEGGIYAEMIRNRNFDDSNSSKEVSLVGFAMNMPGNENNPNALNPEIPGWKINSNQTSAMTWWYDGTLPLNDNNKRCLKTEVKNPQEKPSLTNLGHCSNVEGIAVRKGDNYVFSAFLRTQSQQATYNVAIENTKGATLCSETIVVKGSNWKKYSVTLSPTVSFTGAKLVIYPTSAGIHYLDMVSLFPKKTWKSRSNGLRPDIMEMVAAMRPAFVRFPGGCFVEGLGVANAWDWKKTLGPVEQREGHWNIWGWRATDGLGYHEFLQMCEDLKAEPVHVVYAGISHDKNNPYNGKYDFVSLEDMPRLVQDALDAIEYANGPVTTYWGAKRAQAGHPEPFNLKYMEIGNENHGEEYADRYKLFHDAIKAKYPDIKVVMNTWGNDNYPRNRIPDFLDIHRFASPYSFAVNYNQFDTYDRKSMKVYFGEWCATLEHPRKEMLETCLYEGAFLTGLEKNSDHVLMQSYAPFMKNMGWKAGKPNMINFDLDRVYGTPMYWIQRMYAQNKVDSLLKFSAVSPVVYQQQAESAGFGVVDTKVEYRDFSIKTNAGLEEFSEKSAKDMLKFMGIDRKECLSAENVFRFGNNGNQSVRTKNEISGQDYTIQVWARKLEGKNGFRVFFNGNNFVDFGTDGNKTAKFGGEFFYKPGGLIPELKSAPFSAENNRWYELKIEVKGYHINCFVDNKKLLEVDLLPVQALNISVGKTADNYLVIKAINLSHEKAETEINTGKIVPEQQGEAIVLTSAKADDVNSLENPENVKPVFEKLDRVTSNFNYTFKPLSCTVLRIKIKK